MSNTPNLTRFWLLAGRLEGCLRRIYSIWVYWTTFRLSRTIGALTWLLCSPQRELRLRWHQDLFAKKKNNLRWVNLPPQEISIRNSEDRSYEPVTSIFPTWRSIELRITVTSSIFATILKLTTSVSLWAFFSSSTPFTSSIKQQNGIYSKACLPKHRFWQKH